MFFIPFLLLPDFNDTNSKKEKNNNYFKILNNSLKPNILTEMHKSNKCIKNCNCRNGTGKKRLTISHITNLF